jgi:phage terminase small subunit
MIAQPNKTISLTAQELIAAEYYVVHGSKSDAYRAGYSTRNMKAATVNRAASAVFSRPRVKAYVEELYAKSRSSAVMTRQEALEILSEIARGKLSDFLNDSGDFDTEKIVKSGFSLEALEIIEGTENNAGRKKIKVRDPITAIDRIAKLEGWDKQVDDSDKGISFTFIIDGEQRSFVAQP